MTVADTNATLTRVIEVWHQLLSELQRAVEAMCLQPVMCDTSNDFSLEHSALAEVVANWPHLPPLIRQALISTVRHCRRWLEAEKETSTDVLEGGSTAEAKAK